MPVLPTVLPTFAHRFAHIRLKKQEMGQNGIKTKKRTNRQKRAIRAFRKRVGKGRKISSDKYKISENPR